MKCGTCKFFRECSGVAEQNGVTAGGYCHALPPVPVNHSANVVACLEITFWCQPVVDAEHWCGLWKAKRKQ
jgi:hypothetical protein